MRILRVLGRALGFREAPPAPDDFSASGYETLVGVAISAVVAVGPDGLVRSFNPAAERMFGRARDEVVGGDPGMLVPESLGDTWRATFARLCEEGLRGRDALRREWMGRRREGVDFPMEAALTAVKVDGEPLAVAILRDLSEAREAERRVREKEALLDALIGGVTDPFVVKDVEARYIMSNDAFAATLGLDAGQLVGRTASDVLPPDTAAMVRGFDRRVLAGESFTEDYSLDIRGRRREFEAFRYPLRDPDQAIVGIVAFCRDVTERRRVEQALRESEARLSLALEAAGAGHWAYDAAAGGLTWSQRCRDLAGEALRDGMTLDEWIATALPEDRERLRREVETALAERRTGHRFEYRIEHPRLGVRSLEALGRTTFTPEGRPIRSKGLLFDRTERTEMEREFRAAKERAERADRTKSRFLAVASHDLRQPVQSLFMFAAALRGDVATAQGRERLSQLERGLESLKSLLDGLLDISRLDAGAIQVQVSDFPLEPLLREIEVSYAASAAAKGLVLDVGSFAGTVRSDPTLLGRMLRNLVENAVRYTERGRVAVACVEREGRVCVKVEDTGIGIAPGDLERIWDEFHQLDGAAPSGERGGLGLGLAIVRRLSELLGHPVGVSSRPGEGSVFSIEVPLGTGRAGRDGSEAPGAAEAGGGRLVMVVDDDTLVLTGLRAFLDHLGYRVVAVESGAEAVAAIGGADGVPDVVLADYRLRGGETGVEAVAAIRAAAGTRIPAAILTGESGEAVSAEAAAAGLDVLRKPVSPGDLERALARLARAPDGTGAR